MYIDISSSDISIWETSTDAAGTNPIHFSMADMIYRCIYYFADIHKPLAGYRELPKNIAATSISITSILNMSIS
jgi:hypothetical protein